MKKAILPLILLLFCGAELSAQLVEGRGIKFFKTDSNTVVSVRDTVRRDTIYVDVDNDGDADHVAQGPWWFGFDGGCVTYTPPQWAWIITTSTTGGDTIRIGSSMYVIPAVALDADTQHVQISPAKLIFGCGGAGGFDSDSVDVVVTLGPRKITESLLKPGTNGFVLQTQLGMAVWVSDPQIPAWTSQVFYWSSILHNTASDTTSGKLLAWVTSLSKEWAIPHSTTAYTGLAANFYTRGNAYQTYSVAMTTVGSGVTALTAGDRIVLRFFPIGSSFDKYVKVYRIPAGFRPDGYGSGGTAVYGEQIGHFLIPAAKFTATPTTTNLECTLTLKVR